MLRITNIYTWAITVYILSLSLWPLASPPHNVLPPCQGAGTLIAPDETGVKRRRKRDNHFASRQATQWPGYKCSWQQDDGYLASSFHQGNYAGNVDNRSLWSLAWAPKRWINGIVWVTPFHNFLTPAVITDQWQIPDGDRERSKQRANIDEWFVVTSNFGFENADTN